MTMKPKWEDAPEWANYLAQSKFGYWYWYEQKPSYSKWDHDWIAFGKQIMASEKSHEDTLEERPK